MQEDVRSAAPRLERTPGRKRSSEDNPEASSRGSAPQKPDCPDTRAGVAEADGGFRGLLSQLSVRVEVETGKLRGGSIGKCYGGNEC
jgi:hypothetical protein